MDTYLELLSSDSRATPCQRATEWGPSWLNPLVEAPAVTAATSENVEPEPLPSDVCDLSELDAPNVSTFDPLAPDDFEWSQLNDCDLAYLTAPRPTLDPCPWCRRRHGHSQACIDLRLDWEVEMPFGMWKGRKLSTIPRDYLEWLQHKHGITSELRAAVRLQLYGGEA